MGGKAHIIVTGHIYQSTNNTSIPYCPEGNQASLTSFSNFSRVLSDICRFFPMLSATIQNTVFRKLSVPLWFSSLPRPLQIQSGTHLGHRQAGSGGRRGIQTPFQRRRCISELEVLFGSWLEVQATISNSVFLCMLVLQGSQIQTQGKDGVCVYCISYEGGCGHCILSAWFLEDKENLWLLENSWNL